MANAAIAYSNLADGASLTASSAELLLPVSNIQVAHVARKWRSIGLSASIIADLGAATSIDTLALFGLTGTTVRIRISNADPTGVLGEIYDSGTLSIDQAYLASITLLSSPLSGRYFLFDLAAPSNYVEVGRLFIGTRTTFPYNFGHGWQRTWVDRSTRNKTRGGQTQIFADSMYRTIDLSFDLIPQSSRDGFIETIDRVNGQKTDVLFVTNPDSANLARDSIWGLVTSLTPVVQPHVGAYTKQYQIEERL